MKTYQGPDCHLPSGQYLTPAVLEAQPDLAEFLSWLQVRFQAQIHLLSFKRPNRTPDAQ